MTPAWVEAAKGILVWRGCVALRTWAAMTPSVVHEVDSGKAYGSGWIGGVPVTDLIPDLTDPDTRAAYLRRLAVALGCPEEVARDGVVFGRGFIGAGIPSAVAPFDEDPRVVFPWEVDVVLPHRADSQEEALALAWPADKRVGA